MYLCAQNPAGMIENQYLIEDEWDLGFNGNQNIEKTVNILKRDVSKAVDSVHHLNIYDI